MYVLTVTFNEEVSLRPHKKAYMGRKLATAQRFTGQDFAGKQRAGENSRRKFTSLTVSPSRDKLIAAW